MPRDHSLTDAQRRTAVAFFEADHGCWSVARQLGVPLPVLRSFYDRWRVWGSEVLVPKPPKVYSFERKCEIVQRAEAGESKIALAQEYELSAPSLIEPWLRAYRRDGLEGLRPKRRGRPPRDPDVPETELEQLRRENERLRAEVAYLGKLRALSAPEQP